MEIKFNVLDKPAWAIKVEYQSNVKYDIFISFAVDIFVQKKNDFHFKISSADRNAMYLTIPTTNYRNGLAEQQCALRCRNVYL